MDIDLARGEVDELKEMREVKLMTVEERFLRSPPSEGLVDSVEVRVTVGMAFEERLRVGRGAS